MKWSSRYVACLCVTSNLYGIVVSVMMIVFWIVCICVVYLHCWGFTFTSFIVAIISILSICSVLIFCMAALDNCNSMYESLIPQLPYTAID